MIVMNIRKITYTTSLMGSCRRISNPLHRISICPKEIYRHNSSVSLKRRKNMTRNLESRIDDNSLIRQLPLI